MKSTACVLLGLSALFALTACGAPVSGPSPAERAAKAASAAAQSSPAQSAATTQEGPSQANASTSSSSALPSLDRVKALIQGASQGQTRATGVFEGPEGLVGVLTIENSSNAKGVIFTNRSGSVVLPMAISETGENLIEKALVEQDVYAKPDESLTKAASPAAKGIMFGKSGPILTVFMDPNCYYCNKLFKDFQAPVKAGKVRLRFVMVGFLRADSSAKSAAILSSGDPLAALAKAESQPDDKGAAAAPASTDTVAMETVASNSRLMSDMGPVSTPGLLYCSDSKVVFMRGVPPELDSFLASVSAEGHPACGK